MKTVYIGNIGNGTTQSCGCFRKEIIRDRSIIHGQASDGRMTHLHRVWVGMRTRCNNPNSKDWKRYGGRGIAIDPSWDSFEAFAKDMGNPPLGASLERKDNNGPYSIHNCCWATAKDQSRNRRSNRCLVFNGRMMPLIAWAEEYGISRTVLSERLKRGWTIERALKQGVRHVRKV